jgi:hypothetical protein
VSNDRSPQRHRGTEANTHTTLAQNPSSLLPFFSVSLRLCGEYAFYSAHTAQATPTHRREKNEPQREGFARPQVQRMHVAGRTLALRHSATAALLKETPHGHLSAEQAWQNRVL